MEKFNVVKLGLLRFAFVEGIKGIDSKVMHPIYPVKDYYISNITTKKLQEVGFQETLGRLISTIFNLENLDKPILRYDDDWFFSVVDNDNKLWLKFRVMYVKDEDKDEKELGEKLL